MSFTFTTEEAEAYIRDHMSISYHSDFRYISRFEHPEPFEVKTAS